MNTSGILGDAPLLPHDAVIHIRHGAHLPHWTGEHGTYAVTFRLSDSLPQSVLREWENERKDILEAIRNQRREPSQSELRRMEKLRSSRIQAHLDAGRGACHLRDERVAGCIAEALRFFDKARYTLHAWVIMPNHLHVILTPIPPNELPEILHTWKSYTAKFANKTLGRHGTFWQPEYYDHLIRNAEEYAHGVRYILENPAKAGLRDWQWVWVKE